MGQIGYAYKEKRDTSLLIFLTPLGMGMLSVTTMRVAYSGNWVQVQAFRLRGVDVAQVRRLA